MDWTWGQAEPQGGGKVQSMMRDGDRVTCEDETMPAHSETMIQYNPKFNFLLTVT